MLEITTLVVGQLQTNCHIVTDPDTGSCLIVDPGDDGQYIADRILSLSVTPVAIALTHGHFDHILAAFELQHIFTVSCYLHPSDTFLLKRMNSTASYYLNTGVADLPAPFTTPYPRDAVLEVGTEKMTILPAPGHTPGGVALACSAQGLCLTGDTVFAEGAIGDWRHEYSSKEQLLASVASILSLPPRTRLYPGHGPETTVEAERLYMDSRM